MKRCEIVLNDKGHLCYDQETNKNGTPVYLIGAGVARYDTSMEKNVQDAFLFFWYPTGDVCISNTTRELEGNLSLRLLIEEQLFKDLQEYSFEDELESVQFKQDERSRRNNKMKEER